MLTMGVDMYSMDGGPTMDSKPTPGQRASSSCDGAISVSGNRVKAQVPRTIHYVVLGIALILAVATLSIVSPSRAHAASAAFVQGRATQVTSGTTASLAFSKANTAGNLIVVYVVWANPGTVQVSDTRGNTYTAATARQTWGSNWSAQVFYAAGIVGGSNTVKATFSTAITSFGIVYLHEYSGLATALPVDVSASAAGTSASMTSGAVTTSQANDLLFAAGASDNTVAQGTGYTPRLNSLGNLTEDRIVTTTGSYAGTASQNGSTWVMQLVAFRVASGAPGPPAKLAFVQGPSSTAAGATMSPAVTVAVEDASGNIETSDNATKVSLAIGTNPAGGTLSGGSAVTVASGVATFSGLSINNAGTGYTLTAASTPSYTAATSAAFNITNGTSSGWTTYLQGNDRTGFTGDGGLNQTSVPNLSLAWQTSDAGPAHGVFSQPIVSNGMVYWGSFDGYERATDTSGKPVWQTFLGTTSPPACTDPSEAGIVSSGTVTTDVPVGTATSVLYIGGGDSKVYALNAATGAVLWSYSIGGNPNTFIWSSPAVFGNSVYIGSSSFGDCPLTQGQLIQLNRVTGALENTFNVVPNGCSGGGIWDSPTIDATAGTIYFDTGTPSSDCPSTPGGPSVYEVRASDLSLVGSWTIPVAQQVNDADFGATPTLFKGVIGGQSVPLVGVVNKNGVFYAFKRDALPSGPLWSTRIAIGGSDPTIGNGDIASAAFDGTTLYVGGDETATCSGTVNAFNPSTGALIWQHCFTDGFVMGGVTGTSGGVVAVGEGNHLAVLSATNGASLFTFTGTGPFWGPPSIVGSTLYEGDMAGHLYALTTTNQTAPLRFVQVNSATPQTKQSTVSVPFLQDAGDLNVVAIGFNDSTSTITSVTDTAGNVYQPAAPLTRGSGMSQAIYYAQNVKAATAGNNAVTVQFSAAVPYADVRVAEYSGLDPVNPLDTSASAAGSGVTASSGNLTTSAASELIFGAGYTSNQFVGGTNGFTSRIITPMDEDIAGDEFVGTQGTYAATANNAASSAVWVMQAAAFRVG
jgi:outer membrane protein assembly factor BamB